jgi:hypothetical protein
VTSPYCQISKCPKKADFRIYNKPVCTFHGQKILELKRGNPQAFINWKRNTLQGYGVSRKIAPERTFLDG